MGKPAVKVAVFIESLLLLISVYVCMCAVFQDEQVFVEAQYIAHFADSARYVCHLLVYS